MLICGCNTNRTSAPLFTAFISTASGNHLWPETSYLVIVYQFLQLVCMNNDVKTTQLCKAELLPIHTGKAHLGEASVSVPETGYSTTVAGYWGCNCKYRNTSKWGF